MRYALYKRHAAHRRLIALRTQGSARSAKTRITEGTIGVVYMEIGEINTQKLHF